MQPSNPMHPRGSFSKPEQLVKSIDQQTTERKTESKPSEQPQEGTGVAAASAVETPEIKAKKEQDERQQTITRLKGELCDLLEMDLTTEDIRNYMFKGILSKEVTIACEMKGTLTTLRVSDLQEIDARMAKIRDQGIHTSQGIANEEAVITLSYSWTHAGGKALGIKPEEREAKIRKMAALFIEEANKARINYDTVIKLCMQERSIVKKS